MKALWLAFILTTASVAQIPNGSQQTYSSSQGTRWLQTPKADPRNYPGADICVQIEAAIAGLPATGGTVEIPAGNYAACTGAGGVGITITKNSVTLEGMGWLTQLVSPQGATTLNFAAGVTGINLNAGSVTIRNLNLVSASSGAGTDDGIIVQGGIPTLENISITHFGGNGLSVRGQPPFSADSWHFSHMQSYQNFGDGYLWAAPCSDNNQGIGDVLSASSNGGWGFNFQCGNGNVLNSPLAQANTLGGFNVDSSFNTFNQAYCEGGGGSSFIIGSGLPNFVIGTRVFFNAFGQCDTITNVGASYPVQEIHYYGPGGYNVQNGIYLSGQPGSTGNKTFKFAVGDSAASQVAFDDVSDAINLFTFDTSSKFVFNQKVTFTAGTAGIGGSAGFDQQTSATYTIPSVDSGAMVQNIGTEPSVAWTGPALVDHIFFYALNNGTGTITYTPASGSVNANFTQPIPPNWMAFQFTDNVNTNMPLFPMGLAFPDCQDVAGQHMNFTAIPGNGTGTFTCGNSGGGTGNVTHTAGDLTALQMVIGNGAGDITVDPVIASDGAGNMLVTSVQTAGTNGGVTGVEGDGSALTPATGIDLLYPDSTAHCWKQNLNNVAKGCTLTTDDWKVMNHSGTVQASAHMVQDTCTLGTDCAVTLTGAATYTNQNTYTCVCQDEDVAAACKVVQGAGNSFTITGTGTDVIRYACVGN